MFLISRHIRVANPENGLYIVKQGNKVTFLLRLRNCVEGMSPKVDYFYEIDY